MSKLCGPRPFSLIPTKLKTGERIVRGKNSSVNPSSVYSCALLRKSVKSLALKKTAINHDGGEKNQRTELFLIFFLDVDLDLRGDVAENLHRHRIFANRLDRLRQLNLPLVDLERLGSQRFGDVAGCD